MVRLKKEIVLIYNLYYYFYLLIIIIGLIFVSKDELLKRSDIHNLILTSYVKIGFQVFF